MMAKVVQFDGVTHQFPDDATDEEVRSALESAHPAPGPVSRFVSGALRNIPNPLTAIKSMFVDPAVNAIKAASSGDVGGLIQNAGELIVPSARPTAEALMGSIEQAKQALQSAREGEPIQAAGHGLAAALPGIGPAAVHAGEEIGGGNVAGGLGEATTLIAPFAGSAALRARTAPQAEHTAVLNRLGVKEPPPATPAAGKSGIGLSDIVSGTRLLLKLRNLAPSHWIDTGLKQLADHLEELAKKPKAEAPLPPAAELQTGGTAAPTPAPTVAPTLAQPATPAPAVVPAEPVAASPAPEPVKATRTSPMARDGAALAAKINEWGFSPDELKSMSPDSWARAAHEAGVKMPTAAVQKEAWFRLVKTQVGPPKTAQELFEQFRAAGRK